jgi:hypothetical protein
MIFTLQENKVKRHKLKSYTWISIYLVLEIALDQYLHNGSYTWQYSNESIVLLIVKLSMHLNPPTNWSSKLWYSSLVSSFKVSQQVFGTQMAQGLLQAELIILIVLVSFLGFPWDRLLLSILWMKVWVLGQFLLRWPLSQKVCSKFDA